MMNRRNLLGYGALAGSGIFFGPALAGLWDDDRGAGAPSPVVSTANGKLRGLHKDGVFTFKGIPYGAPTDGARRFLPPAAPESWTGARNFVEYGQRCPQGTTSRINEFALMDRREPAGEDCLVLNVWTAGLEARAKRPVMVWLHGGGFAGGSGAYYIYDGTRLAQRHGVVHVTLNHRVNVLGFLDLAELGGDQYADSGNNGMLDIVAALRWVRVNISSFGGDPGNVTIFGQSGGGMKVSTLLAMPSAKGLFHRAIVESGPYVKAIPLEEAAASSNIFLGKLGIQKGQLEVLQQTPPEKLIDAMASLAGNPAFKLGPVVDGRVLPSHPFDPAAPAISADVPLLTGSVETEVTFFPATQLDPIDDAALRTRVKQLAHTDDAGAEKIIAAYRKSRPNVSNIDIALILASDLMFREGTLTQAERKAALGKAPVYVYYFNWRSPVREGKLRTFHTLELPFVLDNIGVAEPMVGAGPDLQAMADQICAAWVAFAKTGNPNHKGMPDWPAFTAGTRATMILNTAPAVANDPNSAERQALRDLRSNS